MQVLELIGTKWGVAASPIKVTTTTGELPMVSSSTSGSKLNKDAAPFIPSESMSELYEFETVYNCQAAEQPVSRKGEAEICVIVSMLHLVLMRDSGYSLLISQQVFFTLWILPSCHR